MVKVEFKRATPESLKYIADHMRDQDVAEVWASSRVRPLEALTTSVAMSDKHAIAYANSVPTVVMGLVMSDLLSGIGVPWMLGTDGVVKHKREFIKRTGPIVDEMMAQCTLLCNHVHSKNTVSIMWLHRLGFSIDYDNPVETKLGDVFLRFEMRK